MQDSVSSATALRVAIRRAEHQILDHPPVFEDPLSLRIIGPEAAAGIQPGVVTRRQRLSPSFRAYMAARSRYAEDELEKAVAAGVRQYVVLGAGLDTFACRNPWSDAGLRIFEVDHPATQAWKRDRLAEAEIEIPASAVFVGTDFEHQALDAVLRESTFNFSAPAFFSWLGVTPYLTDDAFEHTMALISAMPAGSAVVFDYGVSRELLNPVQQMAFDALSARVALYGEPFCLFFEPEQLKSRLLQMGFRSVEDLSSEDLNKRYFENRADRLRVKSRLARLICVTV